MEPKIKIEIRDFFFTPGVLTGEVKEQFELVEFKMKTATTPETIFGIEPENIDELIDFLQQSKAALL